MWIPVATWLFYQGETGWALFTAVLGIIINVLDNLIKPLVIVECSLIGQTSVRPNHARFP